MIQRWAKLLRDPGSLSLALACLFLGGAICAQEAGQQLLRNGDFEEAEEGSPLGWHHSGDGTWQLDEGVFGNSSLRLSVSSEEQDQAKLWVSSDRFAVSPEQLYLLIFWPKSAGLKYQKGVYAEIYWSFQNAAGQGISVWQEWKALIQEHSTEGRWNVGQLIVKPPPEAVSASLSIFLGAHSPGFSPTVWFDGLRVEEYHPPALAETTYFYPGIRHGIGADRVPDPDSTTGVAWKAEVGKHARGSKISGPIIADQPPGQYRAVFCLKVSDNTSDQRVAFLRVAGPGLVNSSCTVGRTLRGTDFARAGQYQEFSLEFIRSPFGGVQYLVGWEAITDLWIDGITVIEERLFSDQDLVALYGLDQVPAGSFELGDQAFVCRGLNYGHWKLKEALRQAGVEIGQASYLYLGRGRTMKLDPPFPHSAEQLQGYSLLVLADVDVEALGFAGRRLVKDFVASGGSLLVLGGFYSFGRGNVQRSFIEDLLPVQVQQTFDLRPLPRPGVLQPAREGFFPTGLTWDREPLCLWAHRLKIKPDADVLVEAGGHPFLLTGTYGQGRIAICTGSVLGIPPEGGVAFWEWEDWPQLLTEVIRYLNG